MIQESYSMPVLFLQFVPILWKNHQMLIMFFKSHGKTIKSLKYENNIYVKVKHTEQWTWKKSIKQ